MRAASVTSLTQEVERRVRAVQSLMKTQDLKTVLAVATGAPSLTGWLRYLTGADLREDYAFVVIGRDDPAPLVVVESPEVAAAIEQTPATIRVESTFDRGMRPIDPAIDALAGLTAGRGRVGVLGVGSQMSFLDFGTLKTALPAVDFVDITHDVNRLRMVKSPFEVAAMQEMGRLLSEGLDLFAARARPGLETAEVAGEIEGFLRGRGCYWGTSKYSLDERPYLFPPSPNRRFAPEDVVLYEFVYSGALGYWSILSSLYSFKTLPDDTARRFRATMDAIQETARVVVPGATCRDIGAASDRVFKAHGFAVIGKHTIDCHPIGLDINDGPRDIAPEWPLEENMTIAVHPASLLEGDLGFFLCDVFLVKSGGAVPLSPRTSFYELLDS